MIIERNKYRFKFMSLLIFLIIAAFLFRLAQLQIVKERSIEKLQKINVKENNYPCGKR